MTRAEHYDYAKRYSAMTVGAALGWWSRGEGAPLWCLLVGGGVWFVYHAWQYVRSEP